MVYVSRDVFEPWSREVLEPTVSLALLLDVPPLREAVVSRLCERRCWSRFREKHCCTSRELVKFRDIFSILAYSLHA